MSWTTDTTIGALPAGAPLEIWRGRLLIMKTTARQLLRSGRMQPWMSVGQLEFAFSTKTAEARLVAGVTPGTGFVDIPFFDLKTAAGQAAFITFGKPSGAANTNVRA